jgi:hypothetical protein
LRLSVRTLVSGVTAHVLARQRLPEGVRHLLGDQGHGAVPLRHGLDRFVGERRPEPALAA